MSDPNKIWLELELCLHQDEEVEIIKRLTDRIATLEAQHTQDKARIEALESALEKALQRSKDDLNWVL